MTGANKLDEANQSDPPGIVRVDRPVRPWVLSRAADDVIAERVRQVSGEGWTPEHDDQHSDGSMALAAACYASNAATWASKGTAQLREKYPLLSLSFRWPWALEWWKPKSQRRDLVRAAALIIAEIERLDRRGA